MAYYNSSYYGADDLGEYYLTPYVEIHDHSAPNQELISYSSYEPSIGNLFEYNPAPTPYYDVCHSNPTWPTISYSASAYTKPLSIEFDPKFYGESYDSDVTRFVVSYSVSEFNEPEWEEYDPTPYDGGFDLAQTYGKPLSPSDETCYPRSESAPAPAPVGGLKVPSLNGLSDGSLAVIPLSGKNEIDEQPSKDSKPTNESKPIQAVEEVHHPEKIGEDLPSPAHENGNETNSGSGIYEYEKQVYQIPSGSGLEAMDICESLFGYWPCLSRDFKRGNNGAFEEISCEGRYGINPWKGTADYLFGSSNPYGEETRDEGSNYGGPIYAYQRHYLEHEED